MTDPTRAPDSLWWQHGVIYQIYPRSFRDSNGDGVGDLPGILSRLDYLAWLGVDAIWLSPFYPSPMKDFGYDIADYTDVDPCFGTLADFDALIAAAHAQGIRVIVDFVPNHSSDQHPWFRASRSARDHHQREWYVWADAKPDGSPPNNWLSVFGGPAWEWDAGTGQYYLHSFLREQPDLNWRHPPVRAAMLDVLRFWLARGVDGFRIDVAHFVMKDPALRDNPPNPEARATQHRPLGDYDRFLHVHDSGHPDVHEVFRDIRRVLDAASAERPRMAVGEIHVFDYARWATYYGAQLDELHMPFNFGLLGVAWDAPEVRKLIARLEAALPPGAWPNYVLGNHDEPRIASRLGPARARVATLMLLTLRGTPTLYYGDELGMPNTPIAPECEQDPWGKLTPGFALGRDPERTPMQWDPSPNAGFAPAGAPPWLPLGEDWATRNVAVQRSDPRSPLALSRALLAARRASPALHAGSYVEIPVGCEHVFAYERRAGRERRLVVLNFAAHAQTVDLGQSGRGASARVSVSTHLDREDTVELAALRLRADEGLLLALPDAPE